jgi:hypothetical protein
MTSLPERTPKKTTILSIVALLINGCKQAFPLLTVDLPRARHNILLVGRPLLITEYRTTIKSAPPVRRVSVKSKFHFWTPRSRSVILLKIARAQICLGGGLRKLLKSVRIVEAVSEKLPLLFLWLVWKIPVSGPRMFVHRATTYKKQTLKYRR